MAQSSANTSNEDNLSTGSSKMSNKSVGNGKTKPSYKHVPHSQKPAHLVAKRNARERRRVQAVNQAFYRLRKCVPIENRNKRVSKVKTLQRAIDYIRKLERILEEDDATDQFVISTTACLQESPASKRLNEVNPIQTNCDQHPPQPNEIIRTQPARGKRGRKPTKSVDQQSVPVPVPVTCVDNSSISSRHQQLESIVYTAAISTIALEAAPTTTTTTTTTSTSATSRSNELNSSYHQDHPNQVYPTMTSCPVSLFQQQQPDSISRESSASNMTNQYQTITGAYPTTTGSQLDFSANNYNQYQYNISHHNYNTNPIDERNFQPNGIDPYAYAPLNGFYHHHQQPTSIYSNSTDYNGSNTQPGPDGWHLTNGHQQLPVMVKQPADSSTFSSSSSSSSTSSSSSASSSISSADTTATVSGDNSSSRAVVCGPSPLATTRGTPALAQPINGAFDGPQQVNSSIIGGYSAYAQATTHLSAVMASPEVPSFAVNSTKTLTAAIDTASAYLDQSLATATVATTTTTAKTTTAATTTSSSRQATDGIANNNEIAQVTTGASHQNQAQAQQHGHHVRHLFNGGLSTNNNLHDQHQQQLHYHNLSQQHNNTHHNQHHHHHHHQQQQQQSYNQSSFLLNNQTNFPSASPSVSSSNYMSNDKR